MKQKNKLIILLLAIALIIAVVISISIGPVKIAFFDVAKILLSKIINITGINPTYDTIIWNIRFPRVYLAIIAGAALAVAGVSFQALLRNPLADPYVIGVSSGAALGASIAIALGLMTIIPFAGFIGALLTMYIVYNLAKTGNRIPINSLLLAGVVMAAFLGSIISLIMSLMGEDMTKIYFWLMGSLSETNIELIIIVTIIVLIGITIIYALARELNLILLGEEPAQHLGVNAETIKKILFAGASIITGAVVSITGLIGFVGLIIPHVMRLILGPDHRTLIIASALFGAIFLIIADTFARTIIAPREIPIGVITAIVGGPFFLFLLQRKKKWL